MATRAEFRRPADLIHTHARRYDADNAGTVLQSLRAVKAFLDTNADKLADVVATGGGNDSTRQSRIVRRLDRLEKHPKTGSAGATR
jgi:hypothetical protein